MRKNKQQNKQREREERKLIYANRFREEEVQI